MKPNISYEDFDKLDLRVGEIVDCVRKEGSEKLLRLTVDFGEVGKRNILSGLYPIYKPENIKGKQFVFAVNLHPRKLMGEISEGMILCADGNRPIPIKPRQKSKVGAQIK